MILLLRVCVFFQQSEDAFCAQTRTEPNEVDGNSSGMIYTRQKERK